MQSIDPEQAYAIFELFTATLCADKTARTNAEMTLQLRHHEDPTFLIQLFQFISVDCVSMLTMLQGKEPMVLAAVQAAQLSAAIRFRNFISGKVYEQVREDQINPDGTTVSVVTKTTQMSADWRENEFIHPQAREFIKTHFVSVATQGPTMNEKIRSQIIGTGQHIIDIELTSKESTKKSKKNKAVATTAGTTWDQSLVPQLLNSLHQQMISIQASKTSGMTDDDCLTLLTQHRASLTILTNVSMSYAVFSNITEERKNDFTNTIFPAVIQILNTLNDFYNFHFGERLMVTVGSSLMDVMASLSTGSVITESNMFDVLGFSKAHSGLFTECNKCVHFGLKCLNAFMKEELPAVINDATTNTNKGLFATFLECLLTAWVQRVVFLYSPQSSMCIEIPDILRGFFTYRMAAQAAYQLNGIPTSTSDFFDITMTSPFFQSLKWIAKHLLCLQLHLGLHRLSLVPKWERAVAMEFQNKYASSIARLFYTHIQWHHHPTEVCIPHEQLELKILIKSLHSSKSYSRAIEFLDSGVSNGALYYEFIHPLIAEPLLTKYLFSRLCFTEEDRILWFDNPEEYFRKQGDFKQDVSPKVLSMALILKLCTVAPPESVKAQTESKRGQGNVSSKPAKGEGKKDHNGMATALFYKFMQFINEKLAEKQTLLASSPLSVGDLSDPNNSYQLSTDACFFAIAELRNALFNANVSSSIIEGILSNYVHRELASPCSYLRAKAVYVLAVYRRKVKWSSPSVYQAILIDVIKLLDDSELPVRMQTCFSITKLINIEDSIPIVSPQIVSIIQKYLGFMREMDNAQAIRTLRKTINFYSETLIQWAVQLTEFLVNYFSKIFHVTLTKTVEYANEEADPAIDNITEMLNIGTKSKETDNYNELLFAIDEIILTIKTLITSMPKVVECTFSNQNEGAAVKLELVPVYEGIQNTVVPMVVHLINISNPMYKKALAASTGASHHGAAFDGSVCSTSFSFLDALLEVVTNLIDHSGVVVVPGLSALFPALHGLMVYAGGAIDYFPQMAAPMDNIISVDVVGFVRGRGHTWKESVTIQQQQTSPLNTSVTNVEILQHMIEIVLLDTSHHMRLSEMAAAPRIVEQLFVYIAMNRGQIPMPYSAVSSTLFYQANGSTGPVLSDTELNDCITALLPSIIQCAQSRQHLSPTFMYLLGMVVCAGIAMSPATAISVISCSGLTLTQFIGSVTKMTSSLIADDMQMRQFHIICWMLASLLSLDPAQFPEARSVAVECILSDTLMGAVLARGHEQIQNMTSFVEESMKKPHKSKHKRNYDEDSESESDDSSIEGSCDIHDDEFLTESDSDDSDEDSDGDQMDGDSAQILKNFCAKASKARGMTDDGSDIDDDIFKMDQSENQLADFDGYCPIDDVNAWSILQSALIGVGQSSVQFSNVFTRVTEVSQAFANLEAKKLQLYALSAKGKCSS